MPGLAQFREQHPEYNDMSDGQLAAALHRKFYSDVPMVDYLGRLGLDRGDVLYELGGKDDPAGTYVREQLAAPGSSESKEQAAVRQGGKIDERRAGTLEGVARAGLQGATFGFGDELVAAGAAALAPGQQSFGEKFDTLRSREAGLVENFREDNPVAAIGSEIAGAIPTGMVAGGQLAGRGATLLGRAGTGAAVGAGQGFAYGVGAGEGDIGQRAQQAVVPALVGGAVGAAAPFVGHAVGSAARGRQQGAVLDAAAKAMPAADDLKSAASAMFESATGGTPLAVNDTSYLRFLGDVQQVAQKFRINPNLDQKSVGLWEVLRQMADDVAQGGKVIDMKDLHIVRQAAQRVAISSEGRDAAFANTVISKLDDFIQGLKPADVLGGADPSQAANALMKGISTWSRANKAGLIEEAIYQAQNQASGVENGLRIQFRRLLQPSTRKLFNEAEIKAIEQVANGTPLSNVMRLLGRFGFGTGSSSNMLGGTIGFGAGSMSPLGPLGGIMVATGGTAARRGSEKMTEQAASRAAAAVATEGLKVVPPLQQSQQTLLERLVRGGALPAAGQVSQGR